MNPLLVLFIVIGAVILWFLLSFTFGFFGDITNHIKNKTKRAMFEEDSDEES